MMCGDPLPHQHHQQQPPPTQPGGDFYRGQPPPPPMMKQPSASSTNMNPEYRHPPGGPPHPRPHPHLPYDAHPDSFGTKRMRKLTQRGAVDYTSTVVRYLQIQMWQRDSRDRTVLQSTPAAAIDMLPAVAYSDNPSTSLAAKFVH